MRVELDITPGYETGMHEIVRMFYPGAAIVENEGEIRIQVQVREAGNELRIEGRIYSGLQVLEGLSASVTGIQGNERRTAGVFLYRMLMQATGLDPNPYGILTGVRPVKLVHKLLDRGYTREQAVLELEQQYLVKPAKARLLVEVAFNNRSFLHSPEEARRTLSVYIGIPYCPTRCHYCSFPGYGLEHSVGLEEFMEGLEREILAVGDYLKDSPWRVESVYLGGGTPTVLAESQLARLLELINDYIAGPETTEVTVEAGRPDTLTQSKIKILKEAGATRLCINPQTMNQATLDGIGRCHTVDMIRDVFAAARSSGFGNINMDLIAGLPGEGLEEFLNSISQILALGPEGITIHVLARKRGSRWQMEDAFRSAPGAIVQKQVEEAREVLKDAGYLPYFLYRQKYMAENLENTGYSKPGYFSHYNIQVMEERQTILGLGGGASSKFVNPQDWSLTSLYHPKEPGSYLRSLESLINRQVDKLKAMT